MTAGNGNSGAGLDVAGRKIFAKNRGGLFSRHFGWGNRGDS